MKTHNSSLMEIGVSPRRRCELNERHWVMTADEYRRVVAYRRDRLVLRQRRGYSPKRAEIISGLGDEYRAVYALVLTRAREPRRAT